MKISRPVYRQPRRSRFGLVVSALVLLVCIGAYLIYRGYRSNSYLGTRALAWMRDPFSHPEWLVHGGERCGSAPFIMPTDGYIGYIWKDSFRLGHQHQGIDIFGGDSVDVTPVISAYPGYLTRLPGWISTVIIRIPEDPLQPERQIWTYYTHMASPEGGSFITADFPPGTYEVFVDAGTLLGYQGNYSGSPDNPVGVHLHFSIVKDDNRGSFRNELKIENTIDPSPYLGLSLNASLNKGEIPVCQE